MMQVLLTYDVNKKRNAKVRKTAAKYLLPVLESVFIGNLQLGTIERLECELLRIINSSEDSVKLFITDNDVCVQMDELGLNPFGDDKNVI